MGLGMSFLGLYNIGYDVGGFFGDKFDLELFVCWVQNGVMYFRFMIYLWNDDYIVNELWMYLEVIFVICSVIELCYRFMFYLYILLWQVYVDDELILCLIFFDYEYDVQIFEECDDFMLGCDILVVSVVEVG